LGRFRPLAAKPHSPIIAAAAATTNGEFARFAFVAFVAVRLKHGRKKANLAKNLLLQFVVSTFSTYRKRALSRP
jgi:hypothetical protein